VVCIITGSGLGADLRDRDPWTILGRGPYLLETSRPGVFAAADVRAGSVKRIATAAGEGLWPCGSRRSVS